jgi:hypothetical protein
VKLPSALVVVFLGLCAAHVVEYGAELIRSPGPLSVRGVNYFPRETPWGGLWTKTSPEVWEKDMALAASLGINTVRTFIQVTTHMEK